MQRTGLHSRSGKVAPVKSPPTVPRTDDVMPFGRKTNIAHRSATRSQAPRAPFCGPPAAGLRRDRGSWRIQISGKIWEDRSLTVVSVADAETQRHVSDCQSRRNSGKRRVSDCRIPVPRWVKTAIPKATQVLFTGARHWLRAADIPEGSHRTMQARWKAALDLCGPPVRKALLKSDIGDDVVIFGERQQFEQVWILIGQLRII